MSYQSFDRRKNEEYNLGLSKHSGHSSSRYASKGPSKSVSKVPSRTASKVPSLKNSASRKVEPDIGLHRIDSEVSEKDMTPLLMEQPKVDEEHEKIKEILMNYSK